MSVNGFPTNTQAQPVRYVEGTGDFGETTGGGWQPIASRGPIPVVSLPITTEERVRAGIDAATPARRLYFNLANGAAPLSERDTVDIGGVRWNVRSVTAYSYPGFPEVAESEVVKL